MTTEALKETLRRELPVWMREDPAFRAYIMELTRQEYADRRDSEDRFDRLLGEMRRDRERQEQQWADNQAELRKMREEQNRKWEKNQAELCTLREEHNRKWEENQAELRTMREEQNRKWDEQNRKWEEAGIEFERMHKEIMAIALKHDRSIGALGSRWGLQSEKAFRDALAGILEQSFDVQVINVNEFDDQGTVFGRPDQVELDVIILNGLLILCELRSSIDKAGMYIFERKARFYEERHQRKANRLIVISPMIEPKARAVAERLGIETYGDSSDVETL